ncbi:gamma-glutamyltransferase family protein [Streptomyces parvulus]|uniref:Transferase n=1 Tax=Streptomyces parvulus TaxID=146923 RepID=A0A369UWB1_9ACTN|nr:gamma-glutamyltransferase [Streptomyces parvulus]RDD84028.1 transferase [Streptomyces parvulus]
MSAATHWLATGAAQSVLERGGNAFDAAVAAGFVLHVVEPHLNGPGGDMVLLLSEGAGEPQVLVGQGPAPRAATIEHFRARGLGEVPGAGALAAAVPGAVEAWLELLQTQGTWRLADVLAYAVHYAEEGYPAGAQLCAVLATMREQFERDWPTSAAHWLPTGVVPTPGQRLVNPGYARTLRRLVKVSEAEGRTRVAGIAAAREEWRGGFVARAIEDFVGTPHPHSDGESHAGVITAEDLLSFRPHLEQPLSLTFRGVDVVKAGFWAQGPVLLQALAILDALGDDVLLDPSTGRGAHTIIEALKLAMADRDAYYGDAAHGAFDPSVLLSPEYARARAALIGESASVVQRPGRLPGATPYIPPTPDSRPGTTGRQGTGEPTVSADGVTRGDTSHIDVVDRYGNMVSATPSGGWLQSSPTIPALGFCLGTRLQMTWLDPFSPSALTPGRRPRTTLSPTMLVRDGAAVASLGTPGGDQQDQWQLLYLLRLLVGGYAPQQAIDAPAFHTTHAVSSFWPRVWQPAGVVIERRAGSELIEELRRRGHDVTVSPDWSLGRLSTVTRDAATGTLSGAANSRGAQGYAAGR